MRAYRHNNLVYIPVSKNASTSFSVLFGDVLLWTSILTENIDWDNDIVFSHIQNPYERHIKGTLQFLRQYNLLDIITDPKFAFLISSACFDQHTYPLCYMFGDRVNHIHWIPLDHPYYSADCLTLNFLKNNNINIDANDIPHHNSYNSIDIDKLKNIHSTSESRDRLMFLLDNDSIIYNKSIDNLYIPLDSDK